jgi:hypothetical protein
MSKEAAATESRKFTMHPKLLFDVIQRQAGSLEKAILEGVMNAVDARASRCDVTLDKTTLTINDDGKGFQDRTEIENFFETFGQPHDESEGKIYGTFRMGRGQLFAFGVNGWESGPFRMHIDIKNKGLDYDLLTLPKKSPKGCRIAVALYKKLLPSDTARISREIEHMVKYVELFGTKIFLNGKKISTHPKDEKWDHETDEAYIKLKGTGSLSVYNLGVLVTDMGNFQYGTGGTVVAKKQLKVNFARNDIMVSECNVWKKLRKLVDSKATEKNVKKKVLTDAERRRLINQIRSGEIEEDKIGDLKVFTDVAGRHWSSSKINWYRFNSKISVAEAGDRLGDTLHRQKAAFILSQETLDYFGDIEEVMGILSKPCRGVWGSGSDINYVPFETLTKGMDSKMIPLPQEQWTLDERVWVRLMSYVSWHLQRRRYENDARTIIIGDSKVANGWTDGGTYICISRQFLSNHGLDFKGLFQVFRLMLHEYCHTESDCGSHAHSQEFYEQFHEKADKIGTAAFDAFSKMPQAFEAEGKAWGKKQLKAMDQMAKHEAAQEKHEKIAAEMGQEPIQKPKKLVKARKEPPTQKAASAKDKGQETPNRPPVTPQSGGDCPYRDGTSYATIYTLAQEFISRDELFAEAAKVTGKSEKNIKGSYSVLKNPNHQSNRGSMEIKDASGKVRLTVAS